MELVEFDLPPELVSFPPVPVGLTLNDYLKEEVRKCPKFRVFPTGVGEVKIYDSRNRFYDCLLHNCKRCLFFNENWR